MGWRGWYHGNQKDDSQAGSKSLCKYSKIKYLCMASAKV